MSVTDPIADMLTRIRNANKMRFKNTDVMLSHVNLNVAKVLKKAGYISGYDVKENSRKQDVLRIYLKYTDARRAVISKIERVSKPGRRVYVRGDKIRKVLDGYGVAIVSTSRGVMTDKEARALNVGGEVLCQVW
ncbi:MAG: 30S ribosomal protein S8 [Syntrophaceae bacterium PtaU1.Bin231]|nr:MAG: 30S ribosomal protein S8 [Syntrophaceae bacterium PtaU1.Bin231]HOG16366.1 30S ribosomal protein S8 [Syntrophales bacterium]